MIDKDLRDFIEKLLKLPKEKQEIIKAFTDGVQYKERGQIT